MSAMHTSGAQSLWMASHEFEVIAVVKAFEVVLAGVVEVLGPALLVLEDVLLDGVSPVAHGPVAGVLLDVLVDELVDLVLVLLLVVLVVVIVVLKLLVGVSHL